MTDTTWRDAIPHDRLKQILHWPTSKEDVGLLQAEAGVLQALAAGDAPWSLLGHILLHNILSDPTSICHHQDNAGVAHADY